MFNWLRKSTPMMPVEVAAAMSRPMAGVVRCPADLARVVGLTKYGPPFRRLDVMFEWGDENPPAEIVEILERFERGK